MRTIFTVPKIVFWGARAEAAMGVEQIAGGVVARATQVPHLPGHAVADGPGAASAALRGPWSVAATQSGAGEVAAQDWMAPLEPPEAVSSSPAALEFALLGPILSGRIRPQ